jgi:hypothetical protein
MLAPVTSDASRTSIPSVPESATSPVTDEIGYATTIPSEPSETGVHPPDSLPPPEPFHHEQPPLPIVFPPHGPHNKSAKYLKAMKQAKEKLKTKAYWDARSGEPGQPDQTYSHEDLKKMRYEQLVKDDVGYQTAESDDEDMIRKKQKEKGPGVGNSALAGRELGFTSVGSGIEESAL